MAASPNLLTCNINEAAPEHLAYPPDPHSAKQWSLQVDKTKAECWIQMHITEIISSQPS